MELRGHHIDQEKNTSGKPLTAGAKEEHQIPIGKEISCPHTHVLRVSAFLGDGNANPRNTAGIEAQNIDERAGRIEIVRQTCAKPEQAQLTEV